MTPGVGKGGPVMLVGLSPDSESELLGPLRGRDGKNLARLARLAELPVGWVTYAVKCGGSAPTPWHMKACKGWLWRELQAISPRVVVTLGSVVAGLLLPQHRGTPLEALAGRFHEVPYMGAVIAPWYSAHAVLTGGKKLESQTLAFFKAVKEKSGCLPT